MSAERTPLEVTCTVHFNMDRQASKRELIDWLTSLPDEATVISRSFQLGGDRLVATWTEGR